LALCILAYTDIKRGIIPDKVILGLLVLTVIKTLYTGQWQPGLYGVAIASILILPYIFGGLGAGDVKLFMVLGLIIGPGIIILMAISWVLASFGFILNRLFKKEVDKIPLAPYVLAGYLLLGGVFIVFKFA